MLNTKQVFYKKLTSGCNFTLPVWDLPYLIITGNYQGNMKLTVIIGDKPPLAPINGIPLYCNKNERMELLKSKNLPTPGSCMEKYMNTIKYSCYILQYDCDLHL